MNNVISPIEHHDRLWEAMQQAQVRRFDNRTPENEAAFFQAHAKWARFFGLWCRYDDGPLHKAGVAKCQ